MFKKIVSSIYNRVSAYLYLFKSINGIECNILTSEETMDKVLNEKKSLIRFGDGEFTFFKGGGISYQKFEPDIKANFIKLVDQYNGKSKYILCVPKYYFQCSSFKLLKKFSYVMAWSKNRIYFKENFNLDNTYGDAFIFGKENFEIYDSFFKNIKKYKVIFVHNSDVYAKEFQQKYGNETFFIQVPKKNSYTNIDEVSNNIIDIVENKKEDYIILISAGPMAKILVKRLSDDGLWAIDTGHCWDEPLHVEGINEKK